MQQQTLFCEDIYEALRTDIQALGGYKKVGKILWPEKDTQKAGDYLSTCLLVHRAEKLDIEQIMLIARMAREKGSYHTTVQFCFETGFSRPTPIEPEDEKAQLKREFIGAVGKVENIMARLERLESSQL